MTGTKKWLSFLVCVFLLTGLLAACGGGGSGGSSSPAASSPSSNQPSASSPAAVSGEKKKLTLWFIDTGKRKELIEETVKEFMDAHPDIEVEAVQIPNDTYKTKLPVAMGGNNPPDLFHSWGGGWLKEFVNAGQVMDLTGRIDPDNYLPAAINIATFDGKIYGAPLAMSLTLFFYNKEMFEKNNLEPPKTFDDLLRIVDTFKAQGIAPIAMANKTKWPGALWLIYIANRVGGSDIFMDAFERKGRGFDDPAYVRTGELIQQLVDRGAFINGFNGLDYDTGQSRQFLYTENAVMELQTSSYVTNVRSEMPGFEEKLGIFPFPAVEGGAGNATDLVGGVSPVFSISSKTKYPDEAVELLKAITSKELAQKFADHAGVVTAVKGVEYKDKFAVMMNEYLQQAQFLQPFYDQTLPPEMAELHKDTTQALFGKTITPEEAARQMEDAAKRILDK
mgnify:FL=1